MNLYKNPVLRHYLMASTTQNKQILEKVFKHFEYQENGIFAKDKTAFRNS